MLIILSNFGPQAESSPKFPIRFMPLGGGGEKPASVDTISF